MGFEKTLDAPILLLSSSTGNFGGQVDSPRPIVHPLHDCDFVRPPFLVRRDVPSYSGKVEKAEAVAAVDEAEHWLQCRYDPATDIMY